MKARIRAMSMQQKTRARSFESMLRLDVGCVDRKGLLEDKVLSRRAFWVRMRNKWGKKHRNECIYRNPRRRT